LLQQKESLCALNVRRARNRFSSADVIRARGAYKQVEINPFAFDCPDSEAHFDVGKDQIAAGKPTLAFRLADALTAPNGTLWLSEQTFTLP
jgi:hypothetical protein